MSTILTETSTFSATVTAPDDGDPATGASVTTGLQSLTNRTKYLNDADAAEAAARAAAITLVTPRTALYTVVATATANGDAFDLTTVEQDTGFSQASELVTPPYADGVYMFTVSMRGTSDDAVTDPYSCGVALYLGASSVKTIAFGVRNTASATRKIALNGSLVKRFSGIGTDKFSIEFLGGSGDIFTPDGGSLNTLTITYLGP